MTDKTEPAHSLPPYSGENATCAKCGHTGVRTTHRKQGDDRPGDFFAVPPGDRVERLERRCPRCRYVWDEALAAVSSAVPAPATDRAALRDRIRRVLAQSDGFDFDSLEPHDYQIQAAAILAVLPAPDQQAAAERDSLGREADRLRRDWVEMRDRAERAEAEAERLRRLAGEAQQDEEMDATEADIDRMMAAGVPVQIVTAPPATYAGAQQATCDAATAEHHTVDGTRYLCHTGDHYCPREAQQDPHSCGNCEGVDPDTCLFNPDRPRTNLFAESGVDTPSCDCGHDGMGLRWHLKACAWVKQLTDEARQMLAEDDAREAQQDEERVDRAAVYEEAADRLAAKYSDDDPAVEDMRLWAEEARTPREAQQASCGRSSAIPTPCSAGDHCCKGPSETQQDEAWDVPDARPGTTDHTLQQRHAREAQQDPAQDGPPRCRCGHQRGIHPGGSRFCAVPDCDCTRYVAGPGQPDTDGEDPAEALARHINEQRISVIQRAVRILGWGALRFEFVEDGKARQDLTQPCTCFVINDGGVHAEFCAKRTAVAQQDGPDTVPCSWVAVKSSHSPHDWEQPRGMAQVHCPGYTAVARPGQPDTDNAPAVGAQQPKEA